MPAFNDYLDLRFAVGDHVGNRNLSDVMPRLTQMAESWLNRQLRVRQQITSVAVTFVDGVAPLPADFAEMLHVYTTCGGTLNSAPLSAFQRPGSVYSSYEINGTSLLIRSVQGDRDIAYYAKLPTLTASPTTTNWLLDQYPEVYLYAVGIEAAKFLQDVDRAQATDVLLRQAVQSVRIDDERARWSNSVVRVGGMTP